MPLSADDILKKTFRLSFKGYSQDDVDRFLDQMIDEFKALQISNEQLKAALDAERSNRSRDIEAAEFWRKETLTCR